MVKRRFDQRLVAAIAFGVWSLAAGAQSGDTGLAGMVWTHDAWQKARWSQSLAELNAHNSLQRAIRESEAAQDGESGDLEESADPNTRET